MISAESVLPSASLKTKRLPDPAIWPWAAVAESKPQAEMTIKHEERGLIFGIRSAPYRAGSLPPQLLFLKKKRNFWVTTFDCFTPYGNYKEANKSTIS